MVWQLLLLWSVLANAMSPYEPMGLFLVPARRVGKGTEVWGKHLDPGSGIKNASFQMIRFSLKPS